MELVQLLLLLLPEVANDEGKDVSQIFLYIYVCRSVGFFFCFFQFFFKQNEEFYFSPPFPSLTCSYLFYFCIEVVQRSGTDHFCHICPIICQSTYQTLFFNFNAALCSSSLSKSFVDFHCQYRMPERLPIIPKFTCLT